MSGHTSCLWMHVRLTLPKPPLMPPLHGYHSQSLLNSN
uniref:Uncharacterized protein n=1 Tax=Anguilla anguilla TaxID=7936 RepID=A0A0E9T4I2_ANGAN